MIFNGSKATPKPVTETSGTEVTVRSRTSETALGSIISPKPKKYTMEATTSANEQGKVVLTFTKNGARVTEIDPDKQV